MAGFLGAIPNPISAGIGLIGGIGRGIAGFFQNRKANRMLKNLTRPTQTVQNEYYENAANAENMARTGIAQQQYNNSLQNIQRNTNSALRMFGRMGRPAGLASLVRAQNDATLNLDARDAEARMQNQRFAMGQKQILGAQKQAAWNWNKRDAYLSKLAQAQALKGAGLQNISGGLNTIAGVGMSALGDSSLGAPTGQGYPDMTGSPILGQSFMDRLFRRRYEALPMAGSVGIR